VGVINHRGCHLGPESLIRTLDAVAVTRVSI
jgi:hypothetical protein